VGTGNPDGIFRILAIGSSSTAGIGASAPDRTYPAQLQIDLAARLAGHNFVVENAGISGETAAATVARLEAAISHGGYDLVLWQVGTNDAVAGVALDAFRALVERGVAAVRKAGTPLLLIDQQFFPRIRDVASYERFVEAVEAIGAEDGVPVFSRYALMKGWSEGPTPVLMDMLAKDRFHMSDRGYACVASLLADNIAGLFGAVTTSAVDTSTP
jgi:lysophospholipase L1-like esterase